MFYKMLSIFIKIPPVPQLRYKKIPSKANIFENVVLGNSRIFISLAKSASSFVSIA
ncbi:hypothetical protein PTQ33_04865 [Campylobacter sp. 50012-21]|uniref:hypothetical protein n=1 Tax=Campylobacter magnus TaxID=3026462 RepID=UPI00235FD756|nr:hypothetical protein [Campylobacter magnus]MDD0846455.1 hypothetical protein [Campylobacter magnus]